MPGLPETRFPCPKPRSDRLIWIDLEMTGLDPDSRHTIPRIATVVTDAPAQRAGGRTGARPSLQPLPVLELDDGTAPTTRAQGCGAGCWRKALPIAEAEARTLAFLHDWCPTNASPMCGNSICQDRRFLHRRMPALETPFPLPPAST